MVMTSGLQSSVLVRLNDVTQELAVGIGQTTASVRTLTSVSLVVRERELVVLSGSRGAGERAVLAVVAGDRRGVVGECDVREDARVRLMRIGAPAALALAEEWQRADSYLHRATDSRDARAADKRLAPPEIFLLDVAEPTDAPRAGRDPKPWNEHNRLALRTWAEVCRLRGGAVIMAAGEFVGRDLFDLAMSQINRSAAIRPSPSAVREVLLDESSVRVVAMHAGRLASSVRLRARDLS